VRNSKIIKAAQALFYTNTIIWIIFGLLSLGKIGGEGSVPGYVLGLIATLMFGNAGAMFLAGWGLGRRNRWFYALALAVLIVNIILTFTDQVGLFDWITFIIDLILLILIILVRKEYALTSN
jgi:hypothetical protein